MPQSTLAYSLVNPVLKQRWAALCLITAQVVKGIADDSPLKPRKLSHHLGESFKVPEKFTADAVLLPDWLCKSSLDILCGNLHMVGKTLIHEFHVSPAITASHVRYIVEIAALVKFLSVDDPLLRVARAADTLCRKMEAENSQTHPELSEIHKIYSDIAQRFKTENPRIKVATGKYTEFVESQLKDNGGRDLYRALSSYTHHNAFIAYTHHFKAQLNPTVLEADALEFVSVAVRCAINAGAMTTSFRTEDRRQDHIDSLYSLEDTFSLLLAETFPECEYTTQV